MSAGNTSKSTEKVNKLAIFNVEEWHAIEAKREPLLGLSDYDCCQWIHSALVQGVSIYR